ncbi:MAG: DUF3253 domain-containing protein, partial [Rhizobiaceae bacterium]
YSFCWCFCAASIFHAHAQRFSETDQMASEDLIDETILKLLSKVEPGKNISPMEVAVALAGKDEKAWRKLMKPIKLGAMRLATREMIELTRHSKPVEVNELRGIYRMRLKTNG